VGGSMA